jgi:hypothetical protein
VRKEKVKRNERRYDGRGGIREEDSREARRGKTKRRRGKTKKGEEKIRRDKQE